MSAGQPRGAAAFGHILAQHRGLALAAGGRNARRRRSQCAVGLPHAQFEDASRRVDGAKGHLSQCRIGICGLRAEREPGGEGTHGSGARPVPVGCAVVVDETRLHDCVAGSGVVAARQHVIIAQQILAASGILDQRAERSAAAVGNLIPLRIVVNIVAARRAQLHGHGDLRLVRGGVAGNARAVQQKRGRYFRRGSARCCHHVGDGAGRDGGGRGVRNRAGSEVLPAALTMGGS